MFAGGGRIRQNFPKKVGFKKKQSRMIKKWKTKPKMNSLFDFAQTFKGRPFGIKRVLMLILNKGECIITGI